MSFVEEKVSIMFDWGNEDLHKLFSVSYLDYKQHECLAFSRIEKAKVYYKDPEAILEHLAAIFEVVEKCRNARCGLKIEIMQR